MRFLLLTTAMLAAIGVASTPAVADIVQANPFIVDLGAEGFGDAHRLLTLQSSPSEIGATVAGINGATILTGQAVSGADKSAVANVGTLGWLTGGNVGLGLNVDFTNDTVGFNLNQVTLTLYNAAGGVVDSFSLASGITFTKAQLDAQQGNGNGIFNFVLDNLQQTAFTNDVNNNGGASALYVGLFSDMGCATNHDLTCESNDGPDSWLAFNQQNPTAVPLPAALWMFSGGLAVFGVLRRWTGRRKRHLPVSLLGYAAA